MSDRLPVIGIAFVTGLEVESAGLPVLRVFASNGNYQILEGVKQIEDALIESLQHLSIAGETSYVVRFWAVEEIERTQRRRTTRNI
ncbi:hypothetical protein H1P_1330006 [Hyella patelloides LEGE 07179]|uniref:Uncharacterized protein n=1 Tax=Hyella patelloides LEGE 07179 TaxID=945734 RepID=A0A563VL64_9CYAN|nr:hypothetical protein [Hyella patelloides]VEP12087.1 hypothetical protein H1P_1330006 [Hyella patelloides LEGE 07179]